MSTDEEETSRPRDGLAVAARRCGQLLVVAVTVGLVFWALSYVLVVVVPLVLAVCLATVLGPRAAYLRARRWPGWLATSVVAAVVALVAKGPLVALAVVGLAVLVQQLEGHIVQPRVYASGLDLHPVVTICAISAGAAVGGIIGAFVAVPLTAIAGALLKSA